MAYTTSKTDWTPSDGYDNVNQNRVESNIKALKDEAVEIAGVKTFTGDNIHTGDNTFSGANTFSGDNAINASQITGLTYGDIGTYTIAGSTSFGVATEYLPGTTVNGDTLIASNDTGIANSSSLAMIATVPHISLSQSQNLSLTGVWMLMCRVRRGGDSSFTPVGLFLRVS